MFGRLPGEGLAALAQIQCLITISAAGPAAQLCWRLKAGIVQAGMQGYGEGG